MNFKILIGILLFNISNNIGRKCFKSSSKNREKYIFKENEGILWDDLFPHEVYNMSDDFRVCIYLDVLRKLDNRVLNFLFKNIVKFSKYSKVVNKMNSAYEKKPIALDDFPKYKE